MKKLLSITISIIMLISAVFFIAPTSARAETLAQNTPTMRALRADELSPYVDATTALSHGHVARVYAEEDLNSIVYRNTDGTKTAYFFDYNVKYVDENGVTKDKDITLATKAGGFGLTQSDISLTIPTDITNGVEFTHNGNYIKLTPLRETIIEESLSMSAAALNKPQFAVKNAQKNEISYQKAFGNNTSLRYVPTMDGIKEEIILSSYTGATAWRFLATTNGLSPYLDGNGTYYFAESGDSTQKYSLGDVYTYDSVGNYTYGTMEVVEVKPAQQYIITLNVDEEFLTADSTVYPVYVDPTLKIVSDNSSNVPISDATLFQGNANTPTGSSNRLFIGYMATSGIGRAVMRFDTLINNPVFYTYMDTIVEATLSLYVFQVKSGGDTIVLHRFNNISWSENSITWANGSPNSYGSAYYTVPVNDDGPLNINITGMVQSWRATENYLRGGILFKVADESSSTYPVQIESSENMSYSRQPVLTIKYTTNMSNHFETTVSVYKGANTQLKKSSFYDNDIITYESLNTSVATVNSNGVVTGVTAGTATIRITVDIYSYPQVANCTVTVMDYPNAIGEMFNRSLLNLNTEMVHTDDGFHMATVPLSTILSRGGVNSLNDGSTLMPVTSYYDDWYLYWVDDGLNKVISLIKMREQESDNGDGNDPGVTVSFVEFLANRVINVILYNSLENQIELCDTIDKVTLDDTATENVVLESYFEKVESKAPYLIADMYVKHIVSSSCINNYISAPTAYTSSVITNSNLNRIPYKLLEYNQLSGRTIYNSSTHTINVINTNSLTYYEKWAILAMFTACETFNAFAAEVQLHADYLDHWLLGSKYFGTQDALIRADMTIVPGNYDSLVEPFCHEANGEYLIAQIEQHGPQ